MTVCHGLAHSIGGLSGSTHGETLAAMTPADHALLDEGLPGQVPQDRHVPARRVRRPRKATRWRTASRKCETLIKDIGLDAPLSQQGLKEKDIERAADGVIRYMGGSITNDPATPKRDDLVAIIRKVF